MARPPLPRIAAAIALLALAFAAAPPRPAFAQDAAAGPVSVLLASAAEGGVLRVTLVFSRRVDYRLEESRSRLHVLIDEPVAESSFLDRETGGDVVRRVRFDRTRRGTDIMFYYGDDFGTFSSNELADPFRVVLTFLPRSGSLALPPPAQPGAAPGPGMAGPPGTPPAGGAVPPTGTPAPQPPLPADDRFRVVLDPGHGGSEDGAIGRSGLKEKDLVLDIARRLRARLVSEGFAADLTRDGDENLDLVARAATANGKGADLFVSIHANSSVRASARGAETYFLSYGDTGDNDAMAVARAENAPTDGGEEGGEASTGGIDLVLWEMAQAEHLSRSSAAAELIQAEMNALAGRRDRGVKQAPFRVLVGAAMPAVLVEVGFLTNPDEEASLAASEHRDRIAAALAAALGQFRQRVAREDAGRASTAGPGAPR